MLKADCILLAQIFTVVWLVLLAPFSCLFLSACTVHSKHIYFLAGPLLASDSGDPR